MLLRPAWRDRRNDIDLWLWLVSGLIGVVSGTRFFGHYYWQVLPPICVLAGHGLADASRQALKRSFVSAGVCAGGIVTAAFLMPIVTPNRNYQDIAEYAVAHTQTDQRIFVWGHLPSVYWAANRLPATRIVTTGFLTGHTSARPASAVNMKAAVPGLWPEVLHDLNQHPPVLVFDTLAEETPGDADYPIAKFPPFAKFLSQHYQVVDVIDRTVVYRRIGT
jgi:4-amino-4-deoxy-L-arabinose transferase-like glycosyltransferase